MVSGGKFSHFSLSFAVADTEFKATSQRSKSVSKINILGVQQSRVDLGSVLMRGRKKKECLRSAHTPPNGLGSLESHAVFKPRFLLSTAVREGPEQSDDRYGSIGHVTVWPEQMK